MIDKSLQKLMKEITEINSISGRESKVARLLKSHYEKYSDEILYDNLGSIYAVKRSYKENAKKVMISSHMDEVGFIAKELKSNGLISLLPIGSIDVLSLFGQKFKIFTDDDTFYCGTLVKSSNKTVKDINIKDFLLDIGALSREELEIAGIKLGDQVTFDSQFTSLLSGKTMMAKSWSGRYGCILGIELLEALKDIKLDFDLYVGCTVQEEVGLRGAQTATNLVGPDLAVVLDCQPCSIDRNSNGVLGQGLLLTHYDKSMMPNRALLNYLSAICNDNKIKYQHYFSSNDGDGGWIHKLRTGCPTLNINICANNLNTGNSIISLDDYNCAKEASKSLLLSLNNEKIEYFKIENR